MKINVFIIMLFLITFTVYAGGSGEYSPVSDMEKSWYQAIDKNLWPNDVRENIDLYRNSNIGWAGIVEKYMTDLTNPQYDILGLYVRHHYFNWIENFDHTGKRILLSPDGEGYIVAYYYFHKNFDFSGLLENIIGDLIIFYGHPLDLENDVLIMLAGYVRFISKDYVNPNWIPYGRDGSPFGDILLNE